MSFSSFWSQMRIEPGTLGAVVSRSNPLVKGPIGCSQGFLCFHIDSIRVSPDHYVTPSPTLMLEITRDQDQNCYHVNSRLFARARVEPRTLGSAV